MRPIEFSSRLAPKTEEFYRSAVRALENGGVPFLVGGAYALWHYTGIVRHTKDFDVFVRKVDAESALGALDAAGYKTELTYPHWLGKAYNDDGSPDFVDIIFSSGNGVAIVDDGWFHHATEGKVLGLDVKLCPAEEMIWSKAFVVERERYDGADIAHLIRARGSEMDWLRFLQRFDRNWRVLLSHLVLFGFIYPAERGMIPAWVLEELLGRMERELEPSDTDEKICQGTLLSRAQYLVDIHHWGYEDARLREDVSMSPADIAHWTDAIEGKIANDGDDHKGHIDARCGR